MSCEHVSCLRDEAAMQRWNGTHGDAASTDNILLLSQMPRPRAPSHTLSLDDVSGFDVEGSSREAEEQMAELEAKRQALKEKRAKAEALAEMQTESNATEHHLEKHRSSLQQFSVAYAEEKARKRQVEASNFECLREGTHRNEAIRVVGATASLEAEQEAEIQARIDAKLHAKMQLIRERKAAEAAQEKLSTMATTLVPQTRSDLQRGAAATAELAQGIEEAATLREKLQKMKKDGEESVRLASEADSIKKAAAEAHRIKLEASRSSQEKQRLQYDARSRAEAKVDRKRVTDEAKKEVDEASEAAILIEASVELLATKRWAPTLTLTCNPYPQP